MGKHSKPEDSRNPQTAAEALQQIEACKEAMGVSYKEVVRLEKIRDSLIAKEWKEVTRRQDLLLTLVPAVNAATALNARKIEFIYTNQSSKEPCKGIKDFEAPGFEVACAFDALIQDLGKKYDVAPQVTARTWSTTRPGMHEVALDAENNTKRLSPNRSFDTPAEHIKDECERKEGKNYIVITNGRIYGGDIKNLASKLVPLRRDPKATLDFIVCSKAERTAIDALVAELKNRRLAAQVSLVKIGSESEALEAVKGVIKARIAAELAPKAQAAPQPASVKKRGLFRRRVKTGLNA